VQAGFAPPPAPQQLFAPREQEPVHPGLDLETFQQNVGLGSPSEPAPKNGAAKTRPDFAPFTATAPPTEDFAPKQRVLGSLAKKARTFVSGEDENDPRTIRDLQNTVDVTSAFHAPVYPHKNMKSEDE